jgi:hypothetical protein
MRRKNLAKGSVRWQDCKSMQLPSIARRNLIGATRPLLCASPDALRTYCSSPAAPTKLKQVREQIVKAGGSASVFPCDPMNPSAVAQLGDACV